MLPGVTRDSLLTLAADLGYTVEEGKVSTDEWQSGNDSGAITEVFACGTAAVITPVGSVKSASAEWTIGDGQPGPISMQLRDQLTGIQTGRLPDTHGGCGRCRAAEAVRLPRSLRSGPSRRTRLARSRGGGVGPSLRRYRSSGLILLGFTFRGCRAGLRPSPSGGRGVLDDGGAGLRVLHGQPGAPLEVADEGGAELRVGRQLRVVGGEAHQRSRTGTVARR